MIAAAIIALVAASGNAPTNAPPASAPPVAFDPGSTASAPCGTGLPLPGHEMPQLEASASLGEAITLTVRQDGGRLCYVHDGNADAPVIRVRQGAPLAITLRNEINDAAAIDAVTAAGALKTANLPVPAMPGFYTVVPGTHHAAMGATNLHVHGFAVPPVAPQDDVLTVCADPAVGMAMCGRRSIDYRFTMPADMPAGLYWYHPHMHGEVQAQMLMGLSGAIVVEGPDDDMRRRAGIGERVLVVRQTQDHDSGKTPDASMTAGLPVSPAPDASRPVPATQIDTRHELLCTTNSGIDQISLNGTPVPVGDAPDESLALLTIAPGKTQLWRILNAATDAFLDLSVVDANGRPLPMQVVARDGAALTDDAGHRLDPAPTAAPQSVPPAGRLEVLVGAPPPGVKAYLVTHAVDTGCAGDRLPERRLAVVQASADARVDAQGLAVATAWPPTVASSAMATTTAPTAAAAFPTPAAAVAPGASVRPVPASATSTAVATASPSMPMAMPAGAATARDHFSGLLARHTDHRRTIALAEYPRPGTDDQTDYYIFERLPGAVLKPYAMGDAPTITVHAGTTEEWTIENWTNELHTFHIHQLHFRVLEIDGQPVRDPDLLDVVQVPYATATGYHSKEGPVRPGRVRVKMSFTADMAGDIPFHCHLVDHEDNGMMAVIRVLPRGANAAARRTTPAMPSMSMATPASSRQPQ